MEFLEQPSESEGGLSVLDARWKELQDQQERDARQLSIAIARCYTMKNRHQDVMPYDFNRVVLQSGKDDYINASYVEDLSPYCPRLIATQAPLSGTAADFWLMVYEQKVSLIVMLVSEQELEKVRPLRGFHFTLLRILSIFFCLWFVFDVTINVSGESSPLLPNGARSAALPRTNHSQPNHTEDHAHPRGAHDQPAVPRPKPEAHCRASPVYFVAGVVNVSYPSPRPFQDRCAGSDLMSLPLNRGLPDSKGNLLRFIQEVHGHYLHQRPLHTPVVVHCR